MACLRPAIPSGEGKGAVVYTQVLICSIYKPIAKYWHKHKKIARLWGPLQLKNEDKSVQVLEISRNNNKKGNSALKLSFPVTSVGFSRMRQKYVFFLRLIKPPGKRTQHCWTLPCCMLLRVVAQSLKPVKLLAPCKRTQHWWPMTPNIIGSCCVRLRVAS